VRALLIVDHGSRRAAANALLEEVATLVREAMPEQGVRVAIAHMELAAPSIDEAFAILKAQGVEEVRVMPYFLGPGRHVTEDIPALVEEAATAHGLDAEVTPHLGVHPLLAQLVLERAGLAE
jgi:sirohydrochlorin ferrochelatase